MVGRALDIMIVDEDRNSYDVLILESICIYISGALQGLVEISTLVSRWLWLSLSAKHVTTTSKSYSKANQSQALQESSQPQPNQGDASQPHGSLPIELRGDAFEGSCSQIGPRKHGLPPSALAHSPPLPTKAMQLSVACREAAVTGNSNFQTFAAVQGDSIPPLHPEHLDPNIHVSYCRGGPSVR